MSIIIRAPTAFQAGFSAVLVAKCESCANKSYPALCGESRATVEGALLSLMREMATQMEAMLVQKVEFQ